MNIKVNFNYLTISFFLIFFLIGYYIFNDYIVTPDEPLHRVNGFISLKYILELFSSNTTTLKEFENIPELYNDWRKTYGVLFDLPLSVIELTFKLNI